jgi:hypothetical protein
MKHLTRIALGSCVAVLAGCSMELVREHPLGCRLDEQRMIRDTLYFGQSIAGGEAVSADDWNRFLETRVVATFPQGFSVFDARGYWSAAQARPERETSRVVVAVHLPGSAIDTAVRELVAEYKRRFHQQSVLRERNTVCAKF